MKTRRRSRRGGQPPEARRVAPQYLYQVWLENQAASEKEKRAREATSAARREENARRQAEEDYRTTLARYYMGVEREARENEMDAARRAQERAQAQRQVALDAYHRNPSEATYVAAYGAPDRRRRPAPGEEEGAPARPAAPAAPAAPARAWWDPRGYLGYGRKRKTRRARRHRSRKH